MTEPRKPTNPLLRKDMSPYSPQAGTDAAKQMLHDHCDRLNAMGWCRGQWGVVQQGTLWTINHQSMGRAA